MNLENLPASAKTKNNSCIVEEIVYHLFNRKNLLAQTKELFVGIDNSILQETQIDQYNTVCFLHDCYRHAVNKSLRLTFGQNAIRKITTKSKDYNRYLKLVPILEQNKVNPFAFFTFIVEARRLKKIPCTVSNVATQNAVDHFLSFQKKNTYKVKTYLTFKDYEKTLYNQLHIDLEGLTTYLLRKPVVSLSQQDLWLLSSPARVLLAFKEQLHNLNEFEEIFYEDLRFDPKFLERVSKKWNSFIDLQVSRVNSMHHDLRDDKFRDRLDKIAAVLTVLKIKC